MAITSQREQAFDFSHPILSAGLQVMAPAPTAQSRYPMREILSRILSPELVRLSAMVGLLMLIPAHVLWYFERNNKESMIENASYFPGIFQALWWTVLALVGQADDMPQGPVGKLVALFWVFVGIIYLTYFTAGLTAELTVQEIQGHIQTLTDLQNRSVALVADEGALEYLEVQNIRQVTQFSQPEAAYAALAAGEVEALVAPRPLLLYFALHEPDVDYQLVGTPFLDQFYAFAMPEDSPYRDPINQAILTLRENGTYTEIYRKWFGADP
ncbi:MAG: transporter substrate-binding domain-containing protein [Leptolyngbyaceae cyanobacterium SM2_5_2]|nr:transporter substrate-binding domain-containing protein [Leptolyngbyaceae cyanobacterium SM2_5_2]